MMRLFLFFTFLSLVVPSHAAIDTYEFSSDEQRERFFNLNLELRCPKCQNQSLGDSNAPIAEDLRAQVYRLIIEGSTDEEIKTYLVNRYGDYVLYRPPWSPLTYALWLLPGLGVALGVAIILLVVRHSRLKPEESIDTLTEPEQRQLQALLKSKAEPYKESNKELKGD